MLLNEKYIKKIIKEELGVAYNVIETSNFIFDSIKNDIIGKESKKNEFYNEVNGRFDVKFLDTTIKLAYSFKNFKDKEYFDYAMRKNPEYRDGSSIFFSKRWVLMNVNLNGYSGIIDKPNAMDVISHELEHIYQQIKIGSQFTEKFYNKIRVALNSQDKNVYKAAKLIYGCIKSEQEGFCNGLYSYLMAEPVIDICDKVQNSDCYRLYKEIENIYNESISNKKLLGYILEYGYSINEIKKKIKIFKWRIGRILAKVEEDKVKYQGWRK